MLAIFEEELATAILEEVDKAAAQRRLPLETATHAAQWVKKFDCSYTDVDFIIRALQDQELLIAVRFEIEAYHLTIEGSSVLLAGATLMEQVCAVLLSHPNSTRHELKNLLEGDVPNNALTRALSRAGALGLVQHEVRRVMTASGPSLADIYRLKEGVTKEMFSVEWRVLCDIGSFGTSQESEQVVKMAISSNWIKRSSIYAFLVNPGPRFNSKINFEGVRVTTLSKPTIHGPLPPVIDDGDPVYYTKLALVSHILAGAPASTTTGEGTVFLNEMAANKLDRFEQRRQLKDLPLANALALFMVAKAESDVVAVFLHFPNFGRCRVIVAKNDTTLEDAKHMARILGLCYKHTANDYPNLEDFITSGLEVIVPFCKAKIQSRMSSIDIGFLDNVRGCFNFDVEPPFTCLDPIFQAGKLVNHQKVTEAFGLADFDHNADGRIIKFAKKHKLSLGVTLAHMFAKLKETLEKAEPDMLDVERAFFFADILFHSRVVKAILYSFHGLKEHKEELAVFHAGLGKIGAYWTGLRILHQTLCAPCAAGKAPLLLDYELLPAAHRYRVSLIPDWYGLLEQFSRSADGFGAELNLAKSTLVEAWHNPVINAVQDVAYHCELRLTDHLIANNIRGGVIGVSKMCCETCSLVLERRNDSGNTWRTSGGHFHLYMNRLPSDSTLAGYLKMRINKYLRNAIADLRRSPESPLLVPKGLPKVAAQDDDDADIEDDEFDSWL